MKKFSFPLRVALKYRQHRRDMCRLLLAEVLADLQKLNEDRASLVEHQDRQAAEIRTIGQAGTVDVDAAASRRFHIARLSMEISLVDHRRETVGQQLELCRQALTIADQEVKALEKLEARRRQDHDQQLERERALELEDTWLAAHRREFAK
jgi:flagellar biosynthesis chaperone FliJ